HRRGADDPADVLRGRRPRGRGGAHPGALLQHRHVVDGVSGRAARLHRRGARRHRQHAGRGAGRPRHRLPVRVERSVHLGTVDERDSLFDPDPGPRVPAPGPPGRPHAREGLSAMGARRGLGMVLLVALVLTYPFLDRALGFQTVHAVAGGMIYALLGLGLKIGVGYAGLLDLGYAAFFAIGAYAMGLLNSPVLGSPL